LAAGEGALSDWAREKGFHVTALDVVTTEFRAEGIPLIQADLNKPFPLEDNSIDVVVALEVIEHLEDQFGFMREIARVLKPDGHAIVSTPNEHNLQNRLAYFLTGFYGDSRQVLREDDPKLPMKHINMMPPAQMELAWRMANLELVGLQTSRCRRLAWLLLPLIWPIQTLRYRVRLWKTTDEKERQVTGNAHRLLNSFPLLLGRVVAFHLRKRQAPRRVGNDSSVAVSCSMGSGQTKRHQ